MAIIYTQQELINVLNKELTAGIASLYKANCVNWTGITSDTGKLYTEEIAFELLHHIKEFDTIPGITRTSSYKTPRSQKMEIDLKSPRQEEQFAKRICGLNFNSLGRILDYQVPIRDAKDDPGFKAIDLVSANSDAGVLYLIELKYLGNNETLLRAMLEAFTYYKTLEVAKLSFDYKQEGQKDKFTVVPALLFVHSQETPCNPYVEFHEMEYHEERPMLKALSLAMGLKVFTCDLDQMIDAG